MINIDEIKEKVTKSTVGQFYTIFTEIILLDRLKP